MAAHPRWARALFSEGDFDAIAAAVTETETATSAEIRVHLERRVPAPRGAGTADALSRARDVFAELGMHRTAQRDGVLIYLAIEDHKVAIVGDEGIHARVGDAYWASVRDIMVDRLRRGQPRAAMVDAVRALGQSLALHFPRRPDDTNELSDTVSIEP
jgi:uncharacterized membrane protein